MAPVDGSEIAPGTKDSLTPPEINALLFYRLGQFVVWGQEHKELAAGDAHFSQLLETARWALSWGGIREPATWDPPANRAAHDSQNRASDTQS
ncbi:MAG TPA: hypothetical protein VME43_09990 [Bryobacteraceae bacterium]|nr:hypothetical protein [Bryobacteraceae bacterium]